MGKVLKKALAYKKRNPGGIAWRVKKHCEVVEYHINPDEEVEFAFVGQKNDSFFDIFSSAVVVITNQRILIGRKRFFGRYFLNSITPDMYNDLFVYRGLIWGKVVIDTIKEEVTITNLSKYGLDEIETSISQMMLREKQKYAKKKKED